MLVRLPQRANASVSIDSTARGIAIASKFSQPAKALFLICVSAAGSSIPSKLVQPEKE